MPVDVLTACAYYSLSKIFLCTATSKWMSIGWSDDDDDENIFNWKGILNLEGYLTVHKLIICRFT